MLSSAIRGRQVLLHVTSGLYMLVDAQHRGSAKGECLFSRASIFSPPLKVRAMLENWTVSKQSVEIRSCIPCSCDPFY